MARLLTSRMADALQDGSPRLLFVAVEHPDGIGYFCSGIRSIVWNGHTWAGSGRQGTVSPIKQSSEIAIQDIVFTMSGIDPAIAAGLNDDVRNLSGQAWLGCLAWDDTVIPDPYLLVDSELDFQTFTIDTDGTCTIAITAHAGLYTLARGVQEAWTPENQKLQYPDDIGMDMIPGLQNQDLNWGPS
jgi:hypothetical protein